MSVRRGGIAMKHDARNALRGYACAAVALLAIVAYAPEAWARCQMMTDAQAKLLFEEWNKTLQIKPPNPTRVAQTYATDAILLPTVENGPLIGRDQIAGYFRHFLESEPVGRIDTHRLVPAGCDKGIVAGLYTFNVLERSVRVDKPARYTFTYVYRQDGGRARWLIAHHHSSVRPK
jgi:uncharacterized protein (TIGR02246 family)